MPHRLTIAAVTAVAALGTLGGGLTGTAAADAFYQVTGTGGDGLSAQTRPSTDPQYTDSICPMARASTSYVRRPAIR